MKHLIVINETQQGTNQSSAEGATDCPLDTIKLQCDGAEESPWWNWNDAVEPGQRKAANSIARACRRWLAKYKGGKG